MEAFVLSGYSIVIISIFAEIFNHAAKCPDY